MTGSDGRSGFKAAFLDGCRSPSEIPPDALNPENGFTVSLRGGKDSSEGHLWVGNRRGQAGIVCDEGFGMKEVKRLKSLLCAFFVNIHSNAGDRGVPTTWLLKGSLVHPRQLLRSDR